MSLEQLKEEIISRYEATWDDSPIDTLGIIQKSKENFRFLVENLVTLSYKYGELDTLKQLKSN